MTESAWLTWYNFPRRCSRMIPAQNLFNSPLHSLSLRITSFHPARTLPTGLLPSITIFLILSTFFPSPIISTCPNQFNPKRFSFRKNGVWHNLSGTSMTPHFLWSRPGNTAYTFCIPISKVSNLLFSDRVTAQNVVYYIRTDSTTALKIFILALSLISIVTHNLRLTVPNALATPTLFFFISRKVLPLLANILRRYVNSSACFTV